MTTLWKTLHNCHYCYSWKKAFHGSKNLQEAQNKKVEKQYIPTDEMVKLQFQSER